MFMRISNVVLRKIASKVKIKFIYYLKFSWPIRNTVCILQELFFPAIVQHIRCLKYENHIVSQHFKRFRHLTIKQLYLDISTNIYPQLPQCVQTTTTAFIKYNDCFKHCVIRNCSVTAQCFRGEISNDRIKTFIRILSFSIKRPFQLI